jgi:hypothetical protein
MRGAYNPYALVVWPVREGRATLTSDSMSERCDEGALAAMANTVSNGEVRGALPRVVDQKVACSLPRRSRTIDDGAAPRPRHVEKFFSLPEVEPPSIRILERVLVAFKSLPGVVE